MPAFVIDSSVLRVFHLAQLR